MLCLMKYSSNSQHENSACPRCGSLFICKMGDIDHCDCLMVGMDAWARVYVSERYEGCLCVDCLRELWMRVVKVSVEMRRPSDFRGARR